MMLNSQVLNYEDISSLTITDLATGQYVWVGKEKQSGMYTNMLVQKIEL